MHSAQHSPARAMPASAARRARRAPNPTCQPKAYCFLPQRFLQLETHPRRKEKGKKPCLAAAPPSAHAPPSSPSTVSPTHDARTRQPPRPALLHPPFSERAAMVTEHWPCCTAPSLPSTSPEPSQRIASCPEDLMSCPSSDPASCSLDDARSELAVETALAEPPCCTSTSPPFAEHRACVAVSSTRPRRPVAA
jgi:hypothetical protein